MMLALEKWPVFLRHQVFPQMGMINRRTAGTFSLSLHIGGTTKYPVFYHQAPVKPPAFPGGHAYDTEYNQCFWGTRFIGSKKLSAFQGSLRFCHSILEISNSSCFTTSSVDVFFRSKVLLVNISQAWDGEWLLELHLLRRIAPRFFAGSTSVRSTLKNQQKTCP